MILFLGTNLFSALEQYFHKKAFILSKLEYETGGKEDNHYKMKTKIP